MSPAQSNTEGFSWYDSLEEIKADGLSPVKATSPLCFYRLIGKRTVIAEENIDIIPGIKYCYLADGKYYVKDFRGWDLGMFFFYRPSMCFSGEDTAVGILRNRITAGEVWLLFDAEQVSDMSAMLAKVYSSMYKGTGKVPYKQWIQLLYESLMYEDYKRIGSNHTGYKTLCKMFEQRISDIWKQVKEQQR